MALARCAAVLFLALFSSTSPLVSIASCDLLSVSKTLGCFTDVHTVLRQVRTSHGSAPKRVRGALLAKGPDSSFGGVHRGSCSEDIHMEEEKVEVKVQEEVEDRETHGQGEAKERTNNHSGA